MRILAIDIETTGLVWSSNILSVAVTGSDTENSFTFQQAWNITAYDLFHTGIPIQQVRSELEFLLDQYDVIVGHNLSFDYSYLFKHNLIDPEQVWDKTIDTLILARMTGAYESVSLLSVAQSLGVSDPKWEKMKSKRGVLDTVDVDTLLTYNKTDTLYTLKVGRELIKRGCDIYPMTTLLHEGNYAIVCACMRNTGMPLDKTKASRLTEKYSEKKRHYINDILLPRRIEGGNDASAIAQYLSAHDIEAKNFTKTGKVAVDEATLVELMTSVVSSCTQEITQLPDDKNDYTFDEKTFLSLPNDAKEIVITLGAVLSARHYEKAINTWLLPIFIHALEDGYVHPLYSAGGTVSYRLSCSEPGLQAFPALDIWQPHYNFDYSQAEYRFLAMYAKSTKLAEGYARGDDAHTNTSKILFGVDTLEKWQRKVGKQFNFATIYSAGIAKLVASTGFPEQKVKEFKTKMRKNLPEIDAISKRVNEVWVDRGYIALWNGIRIYATDFDRRERGYKGINQLFQGGVAQLIKEAMITLYEKRIPMYGQIHDSLQFPLDVDTDVVRNVLENALDPKLENMTNPPIRMKVDCEIKGQNETTTQGT